MDKNFTSLNSNESTIFSDKWKQYLIERKNIKKDILNLQEKRNETNSQLNLLQEDEKDRKRINIGLYFGLLIMETISFIVSKDLIIALTIFNTVLFSGFRLTSYLTFGSKKQRKKDIKKLLDTIENYNKQIDKKLQKLNNLNNLKLKFNKSIVFKPIQEPMQTYAKTRKKIIK